MAGFTVFLDPNNNGKLDPGEKSTVTDSSGYYVLGGLPAGPYTVPLAPRSGFASTTPTSFRVTLAAGTTSDLRSFGVKGWSFSGPMRVLLML